MKSISSSHFWFLLSSKGGSIQSELVKQISLWRFLPTNSTKDEQLSNNLLNEISIKIGYSLWNLFPRLSLHLFIFTLISHSVYKPFPTYKQICSRRLWMFFGKSMENHPKNVGIITEKRWKVVAKGEIARVEQFLLLSQFFQKTICCRGVRKRLCERKG